MPAPATSARSALHRARAVEARAAERSSAGVPPRRTGCRVCDLARREARYEAKLTAGPWSSHSRTILQKAGRRPYTPSASLLEGRAEKIRRDEIALTRSGFESSTVENRNATPPIGDQSGL